MFRWLFRKKEIQERRISVRHLPEFIKKASKDSLKESERAIERLRTAVAETKEQVKKEVSILEYSSLQNDKIPERAKAIMQGNREHYCTRVRQALDAIRVPHDLDQLDESLGKSLGEMNSLGKDVQRNIHVLSEFFSHETGAVNRELSMLQHSLEQMKRTIEGSAMQTVKDIWNELEIYQHSLEASAELKKTIHLLEADDAELGRRQGKIEEKIVMIRGSPEFKSCSSLQQEREKLTQEKKRDLAEYEAAISTLELAFRKYIYDYPVEKIVQGYIDDSVSALESDEKGRLKELLQEIRDDVQNGTIPLKEKKREKTLEAIDYLNNEIIRLHASSREYSSKLLGIQKKLSQNMSFLNLAEQEKFLVLLGQEREAIGTRIHEAQHELSLKDPTFALKSIEKMLSSIAGMDIVIVDDEK